MSLTMHSAKFQLIRVEISKTALSPFKSFTCACIVCMDGGYSQGGQPASNGGRVPPPPNETLTMHPACYVEVSGQFLFFCLVCGLLVIH